MSSDLLQLLTLTLLPDSTWGWTEAPPAPAIAPYEAFDPATAAFGHSQTVQLCYGPGPSPSTYSSMGTLDPAPSLEALGPGLQVYPPEDFTSQVRSRDSLEGELLLHIFCTTPEMNFWIRGAGEHNFQGSSSVPWAPHCIHQFRGQVLPMSSTDCIAWGNCHNLSVYWDKNQG